METAPQSNDTRNTELARWARPTRRCVLAAGAAMTTWPAWQQLCADESFAGIWDSHCHLSSIPGATAEQRARNLVHYARRFGITKLICFMGWPFDADPSPETMRRQNEQVGAAIAAMPNQLLAYVYVNPKHTHESLREIDRWMAHGPMVGVKLWVAVRCHDRRLDPIVERVTELGGVVFQHTWIKTTGNLAGESTPADLVQLARRHPRARFICGHAGGNWELGIRMVRAQENISVELAGSEPTAGFTEMAYRELGAERLIYGSDAGGRSFASQLAKILDAQIPLSAKQAALATNLRRLLAPRVAAHP